MIPPATLLGNATCQSHPQPFSKGCVKGEDLFKKWHNLWIYLRFRRRVTLPPLWGKGRGWGL